MHGCGVKLWRAGAGDNSGGGSGGGSGSGGSGGGVVAVEGKFLGDEFVGAVMPCGGGGAFEAGVDADVAAFQARSFQARTRQQGAPQAQRAPQQPQQQQQQQRPWWFFGGGDGGGNSSKGTAAGQRAPDPTRQPGGIGGGGELPPDAKARLGPIVDRLMAASAARALEEQRGALSRRPPQ